MAGISVGQIFKSLVLIILGGLLGLIPFRIGATGFAVVVSILGMFVGFALSLPGVSAARVAGGVAGAIIAKNVPIFGHEVFRRLTEDQQTDAIPVAPEVQFADGSHCDLSSDGSNISWKCVCGESLRLGFNEGWGESTGAAREIHCPTCAKRFTFCQVGSAYCVREA